MTWPVALSHGAKTQTKPYVEALASVGLTAKHISPAQPSGLDGLNGLVLAGGTDIDPSRYGQECAPETHPPFDDERDRLELALLDDAFERGLPVLAICRGLQLLNVHQGGSLHQHIPGHKLTNHSIRVSPSSRLFHVTGLAEYDVISRHHQAIDGLGHSLEAIAWSIKDDVVEAVQRPGPQFVVGVQWHPEDCYLTNAPDARLFAAFRDAVTAL